MRNKKAETRLKQEEITLKDARKVIQHLEATDPDNIILRRTSITYNSKDYLILGEALIQVKESEAYKKIRRERYAS
jgi:chaperonin cofactor prefoldin